MYFQHGFRIYPIFITVSRFLKNTRFSEIPFLIVARGLLVFLSLSRLALCASEMQQTINDSRARYLSTRSIDIFHYPVIIIIAIVSTVCSFEMDKV